MTFEDWFIKKYPSASEIAYKTPGGLYEASKDAYKAGVLDERARIIAALPSEEEIEKEFQRVMRHDENQCDWNLDDRDYWNYAIKLMRDRILGDKNNVI